MLAQELLHLGVPGVYVDGQLVIGGKTLVGMSGRPYKFASETTAATWCEAGRRVIEAERATVDRLTPDVRAAWVARKRASLHKRALSLLAHAAKQADKATQSALIHEADWCLQKWS